MERMHCGGGRCKDPTSNNDKMVKCPKKEVYFGVKTCEVFLCFLLGLQSIMLTSLFSLFLCFTPLVSVTGSYNCTPRI